MQHLREVTELGQLPRSPHAGALWREALQVHCVWSIIYHQWEHAQVGEGALCLGGWLVPGGWQAGQWPLSLQKTCLKIQRVLELCPLYGKTRDAPYLWGIRGVGSWEVEVPWQGLWPFRVLQDKTQSFPLCQLEFVWVLEVGRLSHVKEEPSKSSIHVTLPFKKYLHMPTRFLTDVFIAEIKKSGTF